MLTRMDFARRPRISSRLRPSASDGAQRRASRRLPRLGCVSHGDRAAIIEVNVGHGSTGGDCDDEDDPMGDDEADEDRADSDDYERREDEDVEMADADALHWRRRLPMTPVADLPAKQDRGAWRLFRQFAVDDLNMVALFDKLEAYLGNPGRSLRSERLVGHRGRDLARREQSRTRQNH